MKNYKDVDEFVADAPGEAHVHIEEIRKVVTAAIPMADEKIGYGKPYYKYYGWLTGLDVYKNHVGLEIWDGLSVTDRKELEAKGYKTGSKTFQIRYDQEVPAEIISKLVKAQAVRNEAKKK